MRSSQASFNRVKANETTLQGLSRRCHPKGSHFGGDDGDVGHFGAWNESNQSGILRGKIWRGYVLEVVMADAAWKLWWIMKSIVNWNHTLSFPTPKLSCATSHETLHISLFDFMKQFPACVGLLHKAILASCLIISLNRVYRHILSKCCPCRRLRTASWGCVCRTTKHQNLGVINFTGCCSHDFFIWFSL